MSHLTDICVQLFSLRLPNPDIIYELLRKADARALIFEPSYRNLLSNGSCPVPFHSAVAVSESEIDGLQLPSVQETTLRPEDVMMIFHTSGSTSGSPKLVPCSLRWLDNIISKADALNYLDNNGPVPARYARATVVIGTAGNSTPPYLESYVASSLSSSVSRDGRSW